MFADVYTYHRAFDGTYGICKRIGIVRNRTCIQYDSMR